MERPSRWISYVYDHPGEQGTSLDAGAVIPEPSLRASVEREAGETLVTVFNDGRVTWARKVTGEFDCTMRIEPYPYDMHTCT